MMRSFKSPNFFYQLIIIISFVFSCTLKITFVDAKEFWLDESYSAFVVSLPFLEMIRYLIGDVHPPLYYVLLKLWSVIVGSSPGHLRFLSLIFNIFLTIVFFFTAKRIFKDKWIALLCFLLVQFASLIFYYSVEVRPYMLSMLLISLSLYYYVRIIEEPQSYRAYILFSISAACSFYSHYFTIFILSAFFLHYLIITGFQLWNKQFLVAIVIFLLLVLPWVPAVVHQRSLVANRTNSLENARNDSETLNYGSPPQSHSKYEYWISVYRFIAKNTVGFYNVSSGNLLINYSLYLLKMFVPIFFIAALLKGNNIASLMLIIFIFYILGSFISMPAILVPRYYLGLSIFCILSLGIGLQQMKRYSFVRYFGLMIAILVLAGNVEGTIQRADREYCKPNTYTVEMLKQENKHGDVIIFNSLIYQVPFDYYAKRYNFSAIETGFPISIYDWWKTEPIKGWSGPVVTKTELDEFVRNLHSDQDIKRIWLLTEEKPLYDPKNKLLDRLSEIYHDYEVLGIDQCADAIDRKPLGIYLFTKNPAGIANQ